MHCLRKSPTWQQGCWRLGKEPCSTVQTSGMTTERWRSWQVEGSLDFVRENDLTTAEAKHRLLLSS